MISVDNVDMDDDDELPLVVKVAARMVCGSALASGCESGCSCSCSCGFGSGSIGMVMLVEVGLMLIDGVSKFFICEDNWL